MSIVNRPSLRNPISPVKYGISYPNNMYMIKDRKISDNPDGTVNVEVFIASYSDEKKTYIFSDACNKDSLILTNLPANPDYDTYQALMIERYPNAEVDGTKLKDFEILN